MSHIDPAYALVIAAAVMMACGSEVPTQPGAGAPEAPAVTLTTTPNTWTAAAPMPGQFGDGFALGVENRASGSRVYALGGTDGAGGSGAATRIYDVATDTWRLAGSSGASRVFVFNSNGVGKIGRLLYFSGGEDYGSGSLETSRLTWAYDPTADTLIRKADMPRVTALGVTGVINDLLYVLPGYCSGLLFPLAGYCETEPINTLYRFNPTSNVWVTRAAAPHYHRGGAGGVIGNKFYVVGGVGRSGQFNHNFDVYDPASNTWKSLAPLPAILRGVSGAVAQGLFYVIGSVYSDGTGRRLYAYNPASNKWLTKSAPPFSGRMVKVLAGGKARLFLVQGGNVDDPQSRSALYTP